MTSSGNATASATGLPIVEPQAGLQLQPFLSQALGSPQGTLHRQALWFRWFHKGRKEWLLLSEDGTVHFVRTSGTGKTVRAGPCGHWRCMEQPATDFGMARSDPPVQWLKLRNFSCTGCGAVPVHNLSFVPEPKDRQPATLHGPDGRRIELHSVIYVEALKAWLTKP